MLGPTSDIGITRRCLLRRWWVCSVSLTGYVCPRHSDSEPVYCALIELHTSVPVQWKVLAQCWSQGIHEVV